MSDNLKIFFQDLQERGVIANKANLENFYRLKPEEKVVYLGVDCTGERLHIGHLFLYFQTVRFAKAGFKVLLVLGGGTSKIGDPSDKDKERPLLAEKDIKNYQDKIKSQLEKILIKSKKIEKVDFSPLEQSCQENPELISKIHQILKINPEAEKVQQWTSFLSYIWPLKENDNFQILNNQDWLEKTNLIDFLRQTGKYLTIAYLSSKETIEKRIKTGITFLEFSYPLIQAHDFYYLYENYNCRGQLGGSDQWGNLTTGLELIRKKYSEENKISKTFAFNFPLLTDKDGKKFSKSGAGKIIWLDNEPEHQKDFLDFFLNLSDEEVQIYIKQFTFLSKEQIDELSKIPFKWRVLQRILVELVWLLNYGELESFKSNLKIREEKILSERQKKK